MLRAALIGWATLLVIGPGCKRLPNSETDEVSRMLRHMDEAHRPDGKDLPIERFMAWEAERDAGTRPGHESDAALQLLIDQQLGVVKRLRTVLTNSKNGQAILDGYTGAHTEAYRAMDAVRTARRVGNKALEIASGKRVAAAMKLLRQARELRRSICEKLEVKAPEKTGGLP